MTLNSALVWLFEAKMGVDAARVMTYLPPMSDEPVSLLYTFA